MDHPIRASQSVAQVGWAELIADVSHFSVPGMAGLLNIQVNIFHLDGYRADPA